MLKNNAVWGKVVIQQGLLTHIFSGCGLNSRAGSFFGDKTPAIKKPADGGLSVFIFYFYFTGFREITGQCG